MKYTALLASIAALQPALALPQASSALATTSSSRTVPSTSTGRPSAKAVGAAGRNATGTNAKTSGGAGSIDIEADFGPSSSGSPGKISVEQAKNTNGSAISIKAESSGPFQLSINFNPGEAQKIVSESAKAAGVPNEAIQAVVQPFAQIASSNSTSNGTADGTANGTTNSTSVDSKDVVKAVAGAAVAAAEVKADGPRVPRILISIQGVMATFFDDSKASQGLTGVVMSAAAAGEDINSVIGCALAFMESVTRAARNGSSRALPAPPGPEGSKGPGRVVTSTGLPSSSVAAPTQAAAAPTQSAKADGPKPQQGSQPAQAAKSPEIDTPKINQATAKSCKSDICSGLVDNAIKMASGDFSMRVTMSIVQVMLDVNEQSGAPGNAPQPAAPGQQPAAQEIGKQLIEKFGALTQRADPDQASQIIKSVIEINGVPNVEQVEKKVEETAKQAEKVPAAPPLNQAPDANKVPPPVGTAGAPPQVGTAGAPPRAGTPGPPPVSTPGAPPPRAGTPGAPPPRAGTPGAPPPQVGTPGAKTNIPPVSNNASPPNTPTAPKSAGLTC